MSTPEKFTQIQSDASLRVRVWIPGDVPEFRIINIWKQMIFASLSEGRQHENMGGGGGKGLKRVRVSFCLSEGDFYAITTISIGNIITKRAECLRI